MPRPNKSALDGVKLRKQPPVHWKERWEDWAQGREGDGWSWAVSRGQGGQVGLRRF